MRESLRPGAWPVTVQAAIVVTAATVLDLSIAAYVEPHVPPLSDAAAAVGWPLVALTAVAVAVAVLDVLRRVLGRAASR